VCFHPCEGKCRRSTLDESLSIRSLKRYMADQEKTFQLPAMYGNGKNAKRKVAIVGAGPAGLSCAFFLARLGYQPTVYEAESRPGGMLVQAIPAYRLPREELDREIDAIRKLGVDIRLNKRLGRDFTLTDLRAKGAEAVFLAVGAPKGLGLGLKGEDAKGVVEAIEYLRTYNLTGRAPKGKQVVVVGGGNAAVDAARTALRLGARKVTVLYRRTRSEMPAYAEEVEEAEREGVRFEFLAAPLALDVKGGALAGATFRRMALGEFDKSGRRRPVNTGDEFALEADLLIAAIGQALDPSALFDGVTVKLSERDYLAVDPTTGQTSVEWIFAGGDAAVGPSSVIEAVAAGEKAAVGINRLLTGQTAAPWREDRLADTAFDPDADPVMTARAAMKLLPAAKRAGFAEVECTWASTTALGESRRCLRCDWREEAAATTGAKAPVRN
jgi:NADH-quinone oxidoreductase subunit F